MISSSHVYRNNALLLCLTTALSASACSNAAPSQTAPIEQKVTTQDTAYTLLAFVSPSCPHCQIMQPVIASLRTACAAIFAVREINVTESQQQFLLEKFRIQGVPTFVYVNHDEQELVRMSGRQSEDALKKQLLPYLEKPCS